MGNGTLSEPCIFIQYTGKTTNCVSPTPPDKKHRYLKITYSGCNKFDDPKFGELAGNLDVSDIFDNETGALRGCLNYTSETLCYGPVTVSKEIINPGQGYRVKKMECSETVSV